MTLSAVPYGRDEHDVAFRVAIIGVGPKGMFALERLLDHAGRLEGSGKIEVDLFEPHLVPGAGPTYDPAQPEYLKMNFAAEQLDMWWPAGGVVPPGERLSFVAWRARHTDDPLLERYPPRAQVGCYLADGYALLLRHAPSNVAVALHRSIVHSVRPHRAGWRLESSHLDGRRYESGYDEVMIATGHEHRSKADLGASWALAAPLVPAVFPVQRWLARERIPPAATVAVRGFALTFIDAALALTEGRGGSFESLPHPYRLRYTPSVEQVGLILPFSRTGRPMLAKPDPAMIEQLPALEDVAHTGRGQILRIGDAFRVEAHVLPILASVAASSLLLANGASASGESLRQLSRRIAGSLLDAIRGVSHAGELTAAAEIERSLAVGCGSSPPDRAWALGHSWRALYPALVTRLSGHPPEEREWPAFHRLAGEMERVAFGPPPVNAAKMLALIDVGLIDLTHVRGARLVTRDRATTLRSARGVHSVDMAVDGVLPGPGARGLRSELLGRLLAEGRVRLLGGGRGLEVRFDGSCLGADGAVSPGLVAIGRPTEDSVIGNDTLSRTLHPLADHWARRVVQRSREASESWRVSPVMTRGPA